MAISGFGNAKSCLSITAGILTRYKSQVGSKFLRRSKTLKIANLNQNRSCGVSLDTDETTEFLNRFSVFILGGKLLNAFIQPFKLIAKGSIGQQIFVEDFLVKRLRI